MHKEDDSPAPRSNTPIKIFTGICRQCKLGYQVAVRLPKFCPECATRLNWAAHETRHAKTQFYIIPDVRKEPNE